MQNDNFMEKIASSLSQSAAIKNVLGEPIQTGEKTIVPVAKIAYGFGGGFGQNHRNDGEQRPEKEGSGGGGGGGVRASIKGVYEITPTATRFIPASPAKYFLAGIAAGFLLKVFFSVGKS